MVSTDADVSEKIVYTVAEALDADPTEIPPLERTISADALDSLFHEGNPLPGAYTVFPYCGVWVMVHGDERVDVFSEYETTSATEDLPDEVDEPTSDERMVVLHAEGERHAVPEDELDAFQEIVEEADDTEEAWEESIEYAQDS